MIESQRPSVVEAALGLMAAIDKIERESSDSSQPVCSTPKYDRNCMVCGKAIYQGVLCAECHCTASNAGVKTPH